MRKMLFFLKANKVNLIIKPIYPPPLPFTIPTILAKLKAERSTIPGQTSTTANLSLIGHL